MYTRQGPEILENLEEMKGHKWQHLRQRSITASRISSKPTYVNDQGVNTYKQKIRQLCEGTLRGLIHMMDAHHCSKSFAFIGANNYARRQYVQRDQADLLVKVHIRWSWPCITGLVCFGSTATALGRFAFS